MSPDKCENRMAAPFIILTGASGVGKTTIAQAIEHAYPEFTVFRADTAGVPSAEVMATYGTGYQPGGAWQRAFTISWIERIAALLENDKPILLEGQMRIAFIQEALTMHGIDHARIVLVECSDEIRDHRLIHNRNSSDLAGEHMSGWSRYLHQEAAEAHCDVLDTGRTSLPECVERVVGCLREPSLTLRDRGYR